MAVYAYLRSLRRLCPESLGRFIPPRAALGKSNLGLYSHYSLYVSTRPQRLLVPQIPARRHSS
jgi:hypothetical protein